MTAEEIMDMWATDAKIDDVELDRESLNTPSLHGKYLKLLFNQKMRLRALQLKQKQLSTTLQEYYRGELNNPEDLKEIGREPWPKTVLRQDLSSYVDSDSEMVSLVTKIAYCDEVVDLLAEILKVINNRGFQIKNAIEWRKLTNFGV